MGIGFRILGIALLLSLVLMDMACSPLRRLDARLENGVDQRYLDHGRHGKKQSIRALIARLPGLRKQSLQKIAERTGLRPLRPERLSVLLLDDQLYSFSADAYIDGRVHQVVVLETEGLISFRMKRTPQVLTHELTHSVMRQAAGSKYRRIPKWFIEGSAVWVAGQIRLKGTRDLAVAVLRHQGMKRLCDGVDGRSHSFKDYMEDGLAFEWLEKNHGLEAIHRVVASVMKGENPTQAIAHECGRPWAEVRKDMQSQCQAYLAALAYEGGYPALRPMRYAYQMCVNRISECAPVLKELQDFIKERPDSFLLPVVWYRIGQIHWREGRLEEAIHAMEIALDLLPYLRRDLRYALGKVHLQAKHYKRAQAYFEALISNRQKAPPKRRREVQELLCRIYRLRGLRDKEAEACR